MVTRRARTHVRRPVPPVCNTMLLLARPKGGLLMHAIARSKTKTIMQMMMLHLRTTPLIITPPWSRTTKCQRQAATCMQPPKNDDPPNKQPKQVMKRVQKTTNTVLDTLAKLLTPGEVRMGASNNALSPLSITQRGGVHDWTLMVLSTLLLVCNLQPPLVAAPRCTTSGLGVRTSLPPRTLRALLHAE